MITVNVWEMDDHNVGHASLEIGGNDYVGPTMVSWWPYHTDELGLLVGAEGRPLTYDQEVAAEGHEPHHRYRLYGLEDFARHAAGAREHIGLDEARMRDWWREWQRTPTYRLFDRNCCTTTITALVAGGARSYAALADTEIDLTRWLPTPSDVIRLCDAIILGMSRSRF
jgi:hypothetical protein